MCPEESDDRDNARGAAAIDLSRVEVVAGERLARTTGVDAVRRCGRRRLGQDHSVRFARVEPARRLRDGERGAAAQEGADDRDHG
jgi:hypothetical protein